MSVSLYRVMNYIGGASAEEPGSALFIPPQGAGRIDNPDHYRVLYLSSEPEAAVAESLGSRPIAVWTPAILQGNPLLPGSIRALARYELPNMFDICDLDDPHQLLARSLRPSIVITRGYSVTQSWALQIFSEKRKQRWAGVRWWSYYEGRWSNVGLWSRSDLRLVEVSPLDLRHEAVVAAAQTIGRQIRP